uniref:Putative beta-1,4-xylosyltransferase IRX10 n=1 Tax=Populus alba TaxID=43335 RepID=A0A4U5QDL3_POPAL|nr:putative beta-1,4-xylosyltransferase IRX10 [Populus alba]
MCKLILGASGNLFIRSAGDVLEDDPVGRLKVYVYELPSKNNNKLLQKDPRCLTHMFAAEIFMHRFLLSSPVRTLNPDEADWFYTPIYPTCDLTPTGLPLPFNSPRIMRSAIQLISSNWPYWNRTEGADHFFVVPHDFGACFHYQLEAVVFGCIPVIIADDIVLPFAGAIPWEEIGVFVAEEDVPHLDTFLTSIPPEVILRKQRLLANPSMKRAMLFPQPAQPGDAFHQILNGLARKLPHDRTVFLKPGQKVLNWTTGPAGDLKPCPASIVRAQSTWQQPIIFSFINIPTDIRTYSSFNVWAQVRTQPFNGGFGAGPS